MFKGHFKYCKRFRGHYLEKYSIYTQSYLQQLDVKVTASFCFINKWQYSTRCIVAMNDKQDVCAVSHSIIASDLE